MAAAITQATADKAGAIYASHETKVAAVRANDSLTPQAKTSGVAQVHIDHKAQMDALAATHDSSSTATADTLRRQVFGVGTLTGSDAISVRDAYDRAEQIVDPHEASTLLARATATGDQALARAIAAHAYQQCQTPVIGTAWLPVLNEYAAARPGVADQIQALLNADDPEATFGNAAHFHLAKPREVQNMTDPQVQQLANSPQ